MSEYEMGKDIVVLSQEVNVLKQKVAIMENILEQLIQPKSDKKDDKK